MNTNIKILLISVAILGVILYPMVFIWSLNIIFPILSIPYNIYTYIASMVIFSKLNPIKLSFS